METLQAPFRLAIALGAAVGLALAVPARADEDEPAQALERARAQAREIQEGLVDSLATVRRSSVTVLCYRRPKTKTGEPEAEPQLASGGSGVVIRYKSKSWVVTNQHVVQHADKVTVVDADGRELPVVVHDAVEQQDIALLRFEGKPKGLVPVTVRKESSRNLQEGMWVLATGNPFFLATDGRSVSTLGVVSGLERVLGGNFTYGRAIQHDAEVNQGNSGGPLWNLSGELVGINGMIIVRERNAKLGPQSSGVSFAIPIDQVWSHLATLVDKRKDAKAPFLGLVVATETNAKGKPIGARVVNVHPQSPCKRGASSRYIGKGDVIVSFRPRGKSYTISTQGDLTNALMKTQPGIEVTIKYLRDNKTETWKGTLGVKD